MSPERWLAPKHGCAKRDPLNGARGFTALEVLVAVTIVGVLASLVVPSYGTYMARSRVLDAAGSCGATPLASGAGDAFDVACSATTSTYRVTATGRAAGGMAGFAYTVDETGARATVSVPQGWTRTIDCWTARPDGSCL